MPVPALVAIIDRLTRELDEVKALESRWDHALVNSGLGVWDHDYRLGRMYYSDTWRAIRGLAPDEELTTGLDNWILSVHPDDRAFVLESIELQNSGAFDYHTFEYRERHKDGHWVWIECRGACVEWDETGKPTRVTGTDIDITERKAAEEMLARLSQRLELALETSQIGVFEVDLESGDADWDDRLLKMFGMEGTTNAKKGEMWTQLLHPDDRDQTVARVDAQLDNDASFTNDYRVLLADGRIRHIRSRGAAFTDPEGARKLIGANWDVTDDVALREELERAKTLAEARNRELERAKAHIEHSAVHDYLTGLPNRRFLDEVLESRAAQCGINGGSLSIFHIDLDRFKQINDTLGHQAGDAMLQHAAGVLRANVRPDDVIARIGGDEFVLMSGVENTGRRLATLADRIIEDLCKPVAYQGHTVRFGASIGIASDSGAAIDAKQLLLNADIALYRAKSRGRNRHEMFSVEMHNHVIQTKRTADEILLALERGEFRPYYQPQFDAKTLDVVGVETLARWQHPTRGILGPDAFLAVAEDLDVVSTIDGLVLEMALKNLRSWQRRGVAIPKISVNVSSRRLNDPLLVKKLRRLKITPGTVSFELLESIFLDNCNDGEIETLERLRALGIDIEIDDFGTGHASIVSLLRINPHVLKIDRELVSQIHASVEQRRLVGSIIEIGKSLGIKVVAEGVETREHVCILRDLDCDILQGYALARPMAFSDVEPFMMSQIWRQDDSHSVHDLQTRLRQRAQR